MVRSPLPTLLLCLSYVLTVKFIGPKFMKNREPLNIRWLMVSYNLIMVFVSTWIFVKLGQHGWFGKYNYRCQPVDYSGSDDATGMATAAYWYYITKFVEFADTVFFVLRKKDSHVTTLHVIHHGIMPMSVWWGIKFTPGKFLSLEYQSILCLTLVFLFMTQEDTVLSSHSSTASSTLSCIFIMDWLPLDPR